VAESVEIVRLGRAGDGIADTERGALYVPITLPGETAQVEPRGERGHAIRVVNESPDRIAPICRHFGSCGGCALQHMAGAAYLRWKRQVVADCFQRRGIVVDVEPVVPIRPHSRRRAVFAALKTARGVLLGLHQRGTNRIVPISQCPVLMPAIVNKLDRLREVAKAALRPGKPARIVVLAADNGLDIAVEGAGRMGRAELEDLGGLAGDADIARITIDGAQIFLNRRPEIRAGDLMLFPVPGGFVQAVADAETAIATAMVDHVGETGPIADLFAGIGTFALRLARRAPVTAVEGSADLVSAITAAANATQGLKPVKASKRDLFRNPLAATELNAFGAVVFDPPAAGAKAQAETIAASALSKAVAVSCNPATLARDARILIDGGYRLVRVVPVDQFLFSAEIEVVATFER
jgi:23S rRNA (uracil1939-C5)-methyltransferase